MIEQVLDTVADVMGAPRGELTAASDAETVPNWDSLRMITLAMALESTFDVSFTPDEMSSMVSVAVVVRLLQAKGLAQS